MKRNSILLLTAVIVIALTIALYYIAVDVWNANLCIAIVVMCVSETAIISTLGLLPVLNYKNGSTGIMASIYAVLMMLWSLIGVNFEGSTFCIGLLLISIVMLALIGVTVWSSHTAEELNEKVEQDIQRKQSYTTLSNIRVATPKVQTQATITEENGNATIPPCENLASMWLYMQSAIEDYDTRKRVKVLVERIQALPTSYFPNRTIDAGMKEITAMCRTLQNEEAREHVLVQINTKAKEISNYIKNL